MFEEGKEKAQHFFLVCLLEFQSIPFTPEEWKAMWWPQKREKPGSGVAVTSLNAIPKWSGFGRDRAVTVNGQKMSGPLEALSAYSSRYQDGAEHLRAAAIPEALGAGSMSGEQGRILTLPFGKLYPSHYTSPTNPKV